MVTLFKRLQPAENEMCPFFWRAGVSHDGPISVQGLFQTWNNHRLSASAGVSVSLVNETQRKLYFGSVTFWEIRSFSCFFRERDEKTDTSLVLKCGAKAF